MRELGIPARETNPTHIDVPKNTQLLLRDQPVGEENTIGMPLSRIH